MTYISQLAGDYSTVALCITLISCGLILGLLIGHAYGYYGRDKVVPGIDDQQTRAREAVRGIPLVHMERDA